MRDITERKDIEQVVFAFYEKALKDEVIGYFFLDVVPINLEEHLPVIVNFWTSILLGKQEYKGNPMLKHLKMAALTPMEKNHFDRWLLLWKTTINQHFTGPIADQAYQRAEQIAKLMLYKIQSLNIPPNQE